jgi:hypothetical protein
MIKKFKFQGLLKILLNHLILYILFEGAMMFQKNWTYGVLVLGVPIGSFKENDHFDVVPMGVIKYLIWRKWWFL